MQQLERTGPRKIAIAGASGRVGGALVRHAASMPGTEVTALLHESPLKAGRTVQKSIEEFDITDPTRVINTVGELRRAGVRTVINATGVLTVDTSEAERGDQSSPMYRVHVDGARVLATACHEAGLGYIHFSTEYVFRGKSPGQTYSEKDPPDTKLNPPRRNPTWYGVTKARGDLAVREAFLDDPDGLVIVRASQIQVPDSGLFAATVAQIKKGETFSRVTNQRISPITGDTAARATLDIEYDMHVPERTLAPVYHVGATDSSTPHEVSLLLRERLQRRTKIRPTTLHRLVATGEQGVLRPQNTTLAVDLFTKKLWPLPTIEQEVHTFLQTR